MKLRKIIALLLAMVMVFSLAACSSSSTNGDTAETAAETQAPEDNSSNDETTPAAESEAPEAVAWTWNGQKEVWSILPSTTAAGLIEINDSMGELMEAEGFVYVKKDAEGIPANQVTFVEDAIAAGNVGCLMIAAMDVELLTDVCAEAADAGIAIAMLGALPDYTIAGCVYTAYEITGMFAVQTASNWLTERLAEGGVIPADANGFYEVAADTYYGIADGVYRSNAILGTIAEDPQLVLVSETSAYGESDPYTSAYANAQTVLEAHPDCHIFIAYEPLESMGINAALIEYCDVNGLDVADFCVVPCYGEEDGFPELYEAAQNNASDCAIHGYATYGSSPAGTGLKLATILLGVCGVGDYEWTYGEVLYDDCAATNIYGYSLSWVQGEENPAIGYKTSN